MTIGPWYISVTAVRELLEIKGLDRDDDGADFSAAERELDEQARAIVAAGKAPRELDSGALQYRGGRPLRLRLTINPTPRREGSKPQLIRVQADHEGRVGAYTRSAPERRTGHSLSGSESARLDDDADAAQRRRGGPSGTPGTHANKGVVVRPDPADLAAWDKAAAAGGQTRHAWIIAALRRAAALVR